jgi:type II secretory pathway pseudopilin PulG
MGLRARKTPSGEDGFIIIEVLVSALILAIVAGAVLTLITASTRGAAVQRDHGVASDVAQADQARMRLMTLTEISGVETKERTETRNGTVYTVKSERVFVNNAAGTATCASSSSKPDYVQLTSTVSSSSMVHPVVLQSVVSPSSGSLDENNGTLTVKTANAQGESVSGIAVTATSTAAGTRTTTTGAEGCANFVSAPSGSYEVTYSSTSLVNTKGESQSTPEKFELQGGEYRTQPTAMWDHPATLKPQFFYLQPGTGAEVAAPMDSMFVRNATNSIELPVGTPGGTRTTSLTRTIFPFKSPGEYTAYAGYCTTNNPGAANKSGIFSGMAAAGATLTPKILVPALELTITTKSGKEGKEGTEQIVSGAKVTLTDRNCKFNGINVKRTYTTTMAGHLSNEAAVKEEVATKDLPEKEKVLAPVESGVPFGTYEICVSATINGEARYAKIAEQKVEDFTSKGTVVKLNLTKTTAC